METQSIHRRGVYISYNENKNGPFDEAVRVSNERGCLTWLDKSRLDPTQLEYPTGIIVRIASQDRYFRGTLLGMVAAHSLDPDFVTGERNHRPSSWAAADVPPGPTPGEDFQSVLFIGQLREVPKPREIGDRDPPQSPAYIEL